MNEIESLRLQLIKTSNLTNQGNKKPPTTPITNHQSPPKSIPPVPTTPPKITSASSETTLLTPIAHHNLALFTNPTDMASSSSSSSSSCQWNNLVVANNVVADSGMESQRSDGTAGTMARPATKASSIPRPVFPGSPTVILPGGSTYTSSSANSSSRSSPLGPHHHHQTHSRSSGNLAHSSLYSSTIMSDEHVYSGYSRDELVQLLKQLGSENVIIKRQLGSKFDFNPLLCSFINC